MEGAARASTAKIAQEVGVCGQVWVGRGEEARALGRVPELLVLRVDRRHGDHFAEAIGAADRPPWANGAWHAFVARTTATTVARGKKTGRARGDNLTDLAVKRMIQVIRFMCRKLRTRR